MYRVSMLFASVRFRFEVLDGAAERVGDACQDFRLGVRLPAFYAGEV
jgi:hypothetical protein